MPGFGKRIWGNWRRITVLIPLLLLSACARLTPAEAHAGQPNPAPSEERTLTSAETLADNPGASPASTLIPSTSRAAMPDPSFGSGEPDQRLEAGDPDLDSGKGSPIERDLLLPDLITLPPSELRILSNPEFEQKLLRFTNSIENAGPGKMELWGAADSKTGKITVTQHLYDKNGSTQERVVGEFFFHPEHDHWHLGDFARYEVWSLDVDGGLNAVVASSNKVSYCLRDDARSDLSDAARWQSYTNCNQDRQGISVGWIDIYRYHLPGQSIDISLLPDGVYALRSTVDPDHRLWDENPANNATVLYIQIEGNRVTIIAPPERLNPGLKGN